MVGHFVDIGRYIVYVIFTEAFMKDRLFMTLFISIIGACLLLTLAHFIYAVYAYEHCSIIYFIGKELW